jgi:hypothetical protein
MYRRERKIADATEARGEGGIEGGQAPNDVEKSLGEGA